MKIPQNFPTAANWTQHSIVLLSVLRICYPWQRGKNPTLQRGVLGMTQHLLVRLQFWKSGDCGVPFSLPVLQGPL